MKRILLPSVTGVLLGSLGAPRPARACEQAIVAVLAARRRRRL